MKGRRMRGGKGWRWGIEGCPSGTVEGGKVKDAGSLRCNGLDP
jgi:hypothetical protein